MYRECSVLLENEHALFQDAGAGAPSLRLGDNSLILWVKERATGSIASC